MIDSQLETRLLNTITQYEKKCNKLRQDLNMLHTAMAQLLNIPEGIHVDLDHQLSHLQKNSKQLETGILATIKTIHKQMADSSSKEDLAAKIHKDLDSIVANVKAFKQKEQKRIKAYEKKVKQLKEQLQSTEINRLPDMIKTL